MNLDHLRSSEPTYAEVMRVKPIADRLMDLEIGSPEFLDAFLDALAESDLANYQVDYVTELLNIYLSGGHHEPTN